MTRTRALSHYRQDWAINWEDLLAHWRVAIAIGTHPADDPELAARLAREVPGLRDDPFASVNAPIIAQKIIDQWPGPDVTWWGQPITDRDRRWDAAAQAIEWARLLATDRPFHLLERVPMWWHVGLVLGFPQGYVTRRTINRVMARMRAAGDAEAGERILRAAIQRTARRIERQRIIAERTGPGRTRESARRSLYPRTARDRERAQVRRLNGA